ncbi:MAG: ATP-dependent DNA helicase [Candidatus Thorarchaeota archaeon]|nr:ATP-dependent DNA helicase [Candidatus Thorarchaeota archaeon]
MMTSAALNPMRYFPYTPRPHQDSAVELAADVFYNRSVGLLSADCGVGKTIAVLAGYLAARADDPTARLFVVTRTHSQTRVFESELEVLRRADPQLTATSLVSRARMCPLRSQMDSLDNSGFMHACSMMIRTGRCSYFWSMYSKSEGRVKLRDSARGIIYDLLSQGVVTRKVAEDVSHSEGFCPYEVLKNAARDSRVIIGPYSYLFQSKVRDATLAFIGVELGNLDVIVDEAHNLTDHVLDSETARLTGSDLIWLREKRDNIVKTTGAQWTGDAIDFLWETLLLGLDGLGKKSERQLNKWDVAPRFVNEASLKTMMMKSRDSTNDPDMLAASETPLDRMLEFLYAATQAVKSDDWHVTLHLRPSRFEEPDVARASLTVRPFNSAALAGPVLKSARSAILMSGTLRPTEHYARLIGVTGAASAELASPYPRGTRLILIDRQLSTKYTERSPSLWKHIAERISTALTSMPANKSALVAFPSYAMMREVMSYDIDFGFRESLIEAPGSRLDVLVDAVTSGPHAIFSVYGGKFSEGIDIVEGGSSCIDLIIGVGIPFSPPTTYHLALQDWLDNHFGKGMGYYYAATIPTLRKVVQLIGRLRRSPKDWGVVVLLDRRFLRHLRIMGDDVASDMWPFSSGSEMHDAITQFLSLREAGLL